MRKFALCLIAILIPMCATAASDQGNASTPRYSIFSTSTDWQGITGMSYSEHRVSFKPDKNLIGRTGLVLYYLDGFPCYGLGFGVRLWLGPNGASDGDHMNIACVYPPREIKLAWRNAPRDADTATTTGMLTCPVTGSGDLTVDLSKCTVGPEWREMK